MRLIRDVRQLRLVKANENRVGAVDLPFSKCVFADAAFIVLPSDRMTFSSIYEGSLPQAMLQHQPMSAGRIAQESQ